MDVGLALMMPNLRELGKNMEKKARRTEKKSDFDTIHQNQTFFLL